MDGGREGRRRQQIQARSLMGRDLDEANQRLPERVELELGIGWILHFLSIPSVSRYVDAGRFTFHISLCRHVLGSMISLSTKIDSAASR